jgi:hypothetical protein
MVATVVVFIAPSGRHVHDVTLDVLERAVLQETEAYWLQGSLDSAVEFYDQEVGQGSYPWSALKGRVLLLPVSDPGLKFVVLAEPRSGDSVYLINKMRSTRIVSPEPGAEPWHLFAHHAIDRRVAWAVVAGFCEQGDIPEAPAGHEWLAESVVEFPAQ